MDIDIPEFCDNSSCGIIPAPVPRPYPMRREPLFNGIDMRRDPIINLTPRYTHVRGGTQLTQRFELDIFGNEGVMTHKSITWIENKSLILLKEPALKNEDVNEFNKDNNITYNFRETNEIFYVPTTIEFQRSGFMRINISDIYNRIVGRILKSEYKTELINILQDNINYLVTNQQCITGQLSTLISTLCFYYPDMNMTFTPPELFQSAIKKIIDDYTFRMYNYDEAKTKIESYCKNNQKDSEPWTNLLNDVRDENLESDISAICDSYEWGYLNTTYEKTYNSIILAHKFHKKESNGINRIRMLRVKLYLKHATKRVYDLSYHAYRRFICLSNDIFILNGCIISSIFLKNYFNNGTFV